jgi:protein involved in polysaccharide export with SLBB domain
LALVGIVLGTPAVGAQTQAPEAIAADRGTPTAAAPEAMTLGVGDKVKVTVYERLADSEDRWANQQRAARPDSSYHLHQGISGEVSVRADWRVSVPILGTVVAAGREPGDVAAELARAFERLTGRRATVNVEISERPPIYVLGPVRQPGPFRFEAGLTPLHAVSLAGGLRGQDPDRVLALEALREVSRSEVASTRLQRALVRRAVIRAGLEGRNVAPPTELVTMVGFARAQFLLAEEERMRGQVLRARAERERLSESSVASAEAAAEAGRARLPALRANLEQRRARLDAIQRLFDNNNSARVQLSQAQAEFSEATDREALALVSIAEAERILHSLRLEAAKLRADAAAADENEIATLDREVDELNTTVASSVRLVSTFEQGMAGSVETASALRFEVVRRGVGGSQVIQGDPTMLLEPGDLVRVLEGSAPPRRYAATPPR